MDILQNFRQHKEIAMSYEYNVVCIGLGPTGMAVSAMTSEMGLKVCAIEKTAG
jgi:pyruvate/2-oxoglutarate dehydrogenase complex dihydrolipoamide dehydrogenase (E3) component